VRRVWWVDALRLGPNGQGRWVLDEELVDALFGLWNLWPIFNLPRWSTYARLLRVGFGLFGPVELIRISIIAVALRFGWVGWTVSRLHSGYRDIFALVSPDPPTRLDGQTIRELMESAPVGQRISQFFDVLTAMGTYGRPTRSGSRCVRIHRTPTWCGRCSNMPDGSACGFARIRR